MCIPIRTRSCDPSGARIDPTTSSMSCTLYNYNHYHHNTIITIFIIIINHQHHRQQHAPRLAASPRTNPTFQGAVGCAQPGSPPGSASTRARSPNENDPHRATVDSERELGISLIERQSALVKTSPCSNSGRRRSRVAAGRGGGGSTLARANMRWAWSRRLRSSWPAATM